MPKGVRHSRHDEAQDGEYVWLRTRVEYGDDGILNLRHYTPFDQTSWHIFNPGGGHDLVFDFDATTSRITARQQATQAGTRTSQIRKRILLPLDFGFFPLTAIHLITKRSTSAPVHYKATLLKNGTPDPGVNGAAVQATAALTFELFALTPTATYFPGDFVTLELECQTDADAEFNEVVDVEIEYKTARGNI